MKIKTSKIELYPLFSIKNYIVLVVSKMSGIVKKLSVQWVSKMSKMSGIGKNMPDRVVSKMPGFVKKLFVQRVSKMSKMSKMSGFVKNLSARVVSKMSGIGKKLSAWVVSKMSGIGKNLFLHVCPKYLESAKTCLYRTVQNVQNVKIINFLFKNYDG